MNIVDIHRNTYDELADEYELRAPSLFPVSEQVLTWFLPNIAPGSHVLDVGCGVGILTRILLDRGYKVSCVDISPRMIAHAKKRNPEACAIEEDFLKITCRECFDGIVAFAYIHLFPKADVKEVLQKMRELLVPGGLVCLGSTHSTVSYEGWEVKDDYTRTCKRFRSHWTMPEMEEVFTRNNFVIIKKKIHSDPFGKVWMDFVIKKQ